MLSTTLAGLRVHGRRFVASGLAIVLGVAFVAATLVLSATLRHSVSEGVSGDLGGKALVVTPGDRDLTGSTVRRIERVPGIGDVRAVRSGTAQLDTRGSSFVVATVPPSSGSSATLTAGRLPSAPGEMAVSARVAAGSKLAPGDRIGVERGTQQRIPVTVVGVVDTAKDPRYGATPLVFGSAGDVAAWTGVTSYDEVQIEGAPGTSVAELRPGVEHAAPGGTVRTGEQQAQVVLTEISGGTDVFTGVLLTFAAVALFVSVLVIANTFAILVAQRTREMALLRCVGAGRGQVFRSVLLEAAALGVGASAVGVGLGIGLAALASMVATRADLTFPMDHLAVTPTAIVVPWVVGAVMTVLAGLLPARRATTVAPLEALRPLAEPTAGTRAGAIRLGAGVVLAASGTALLLLGAQRGAAVIGIAGGMVSFLGVLLLGVILVPAAARILGVLPARALGVPGRLAVDNAVRNPRRASATSAALLIGVTLISMMSVGAATAKQSVDQRIASKYALDAEVTAAPGELSESTVHAVRSVDGVAASDAVPGVTATLGRGPAHGQQVRLLGVDGAATPVLRSTALLQRLRPGTVVVGGDQAAQLDLAPDSTQTLRVGDRHLTVRVVVTDAPSGLLVTASDLRALAPQAETAALWLRFADDSSPATMLERVDAATSTVRDVEIGGAAPERAQLANIVDLTLLVVTGLLAIAVVIALVGIANTLSLSVLERGRESALLRALGLTRRQLRGSVAIEALLLAGVAAVLGTLLGVGYAWAGAYAVIGAIAPVHLAVPWTQVIVAIAAALVAGLLASVLPARRAARVQPAAALAGE